MNSAHPVVLDGMKRGKTMFDLHAHITGSLQAADIFDYIHKNKIYKQYPAEINSLASFAGFNLADEIVSNPELAREKFASAYVSSKGFDDIMSRFVFINFLLKMYPEWLTDIARIVANNFKEQGVKHVEWRIDPFSANDGTLDDGIKKLRTIYAGLSEVDIESKIVLSIAKNRYFVNSTQKIKKLTKVTKKLVKNLSDIPIVGLDLCNSDSVPISKFKWLVAACFDCDLGFVPHCGESDIIDEALLSIEDSIDLGAIRLGHAIAAYRNLNDYLIVYGNEKVQKLKDRQNDILHRIKECGTVIEVCPTSNLIAHLKYSDYSQHPVDRLIELDIPFVVCTDDIGIFNKTLKEEIDGLVNYKNVDRDKILKNSEIYCL